MTQAKTITIKGFRNFKQATIDLAAKTLIVGANDIGKSNLLYAIRLLLDRELSDMELEPKDSDFYAFEKTNLIEILIKFEGVQEDCVLAKLKEHVADDGCFWLGYRGQRDATTGQTSYVILVGAAEDKLVEVENRFYIRVLNAKYIASQRSLHSFIRQERRHLLQDARTLLTEKDLAQDREGLQKIKDSLGTLGKQVRELNYVKKATDGLNAELSLMSHRHTNHQIVFNASPPDTEQFVGSVDLAGEVHEQTLAISGDGRANQVHFALWATRHKLASTVKDPLEVTLFFIEEPEAHLHPHQQRRLAEYLSQSFDAQIIITTHSPHIACEFAPSSIVRLYEGKNGASVADRGCSKMIEDAFVKFGYRMNAVPAEAIFASAVLLVEGPSEELFYRALASEIGFNLDRLNISVLHVQGVSFDPYVELLKALSIPFVIRTDNDVHKVPRSKPAKYRMAGVIRAIDLIADHLMKADTVQIEAFRALRDRYSGFDTLTPPPAVLSEAAQLDATLRQHGVFVAKADLENDLWDELSEAIAAYMGMDNKDECIEIMKEQKATFMFNFLRAEKTSLATIRDGDLAKPLLICKTMIEESGNGGTIQST